MPKGVGYSDPISGILAQMGEVPIKDELRSKMVAERANSGQSFGGDSDQAELNNQVVDAVDPSIFFEKNFEEVAELLQRTSGDDTAIAELWDRLAPEQRAGLYDIMEQMFMGTGNMVAAEANSELGLKNAGPGRGEVVGAEGTPSVRVRKAKGNAEDVIEDLLPNGDGMATGSSAETTALMKELFGLMGEK